MKKTLFAVLLAAAWPVAAQDAYVIGVSAAMTGPGAGIYAPVVDAMKAYLDHVNAKGGVNGRQIRLIVLDDGAEPSRAAANAKKLLAQDKVVILINTSLSSTYAPMISEAKRADVPLYFGGSVCPKETYPPADPLLFCSMCMRWQSRDSRCRLRTCQRNLTLAAERSMMRAPFASCRWIGAVGMVGGVIAIAISLQ